MKLADIKYILTNYKPPALKAIEYLLKFESKPDSYELTEAEMSEFHHHCPTGNDRYFMRVLTIYDFLVDKKLTADKIEEDKNLAALLLLSHSNSYRMIALVLNLYQTNLLNQASFDKALALVTAKLPRVEESKLSTTSTKSDIQLDNQLRFFIAAKASKFDGGHGTVTKAHASDGAAYSIKELDNDDLEYTLKEAKREVKINGLLGRQSFYFIRKHKSVVVSEWKVEKDLNSFSEDEIKSLPIKTRFKCTMSSLSELNILHANYRLHGDIKPKNIILNPHNETLTLIDFGSSHKNRSRTNLGHTLAYFDIFQLYQSEELVHVFSFCDDMYSMSIVCAQMFPEIFELKLTKFPKFNSHLFIVNKHPNINIDQLTMPELAIYHLVKAMGHSETEFEEAKKTRVMQCTCEEAINYCSEVFANWDQLSEPMINTVADNTIYCSSIKLNDAIHGHLSVMKR